MVFKFSNKISDRQAKLNRKILKLDCFSNKVVFVNGFSASGKTMLSPIISSINNTESTIYPYELEWVASLLYSNNLTPYGFKEFLKQYCDHTIYNQMMSRNSNFRLNDVSSVLTRKDFLKYFKRLFELGDNYIPEKIDRLRPISCYTTSHLIFFINEIFESLDSRCLFIETVRDPIYMFKQIKILFKEVYKSNPKKLFSFLASSRKKYSLFFDLYSHESSFVNFNDTKNLNKVCVNYLDRIFEFYFNYDFSKIKNKNSKFLLLPFEKFVLKPDYWINNILHFLKQKKNKKLEKELKNQNVPRKFLTDGITRQVYQRYGHNPNLNKLKNNLTYEEADQLYINSIKELFNNSDMKYFNKLLRISNQYRKWVNNFDGFVF